MAEVMILGMKKSALRNEFSFEKSWDVVEVINKIVGKLGMDEVPEHNLKDLICGCREPGPKFGIEEIEDVIYNMKNENYSVDVFLGINKIIFVVNSLTDKQNEICEAVFEFGDFGGENGN